MAIIKMTDLDLFGKRVLIRSDLNVPIQNGKITSDARILASLPAIKFALKQGAYVIIASHLGRPLEGQYDSECSLYPVVNYLKNRLSFPVRLCKNYLHGVDFLKGEIVVLENVRFNKGEQTDDETLAKKYANLCDVFVMDAFATAHRAQASTHGIARFASVACAGPLLCNEIQSLKRVTNNPNRPMVAIVSGAKVSTKIAVLDALSNIADHVIVGGAIANTVIAAHGYRIGKSLYEASLIPVIKHLLKRENILIPIDVVTATQISERAIKRVTSVDDVQDDEYILDIGGNSSLMLEGILKEARTILWNGPIGMFEFPSCRQGTAAVAHAVATSKAFSVVGGGDTLSAINLFKFTEQISYISTGGGAFLEFIAGNKLPAVTMLENRAEQSCKIK